MVRSFHLRDNETLTLRTMAQNEQRELAGMQNIFIKRLHSPSSESPLISYFRETKFARLPEMFFSLKQNDIEFFMYSELNQICSDIRLEYSQKYDKDFPTIITHFFKFEDLNA